VLQIAVGALLLAASIFLTINQTWVVLLARLVEIPDEEYPKWLRGSRLFPHRHRIFQLNFAGVMFITGLAFIVSGIGL